MSDASKPPVTHLTGALIPAKYVTLAGSMAVGGMQTRNFDAVRDGCEIHLHTETGGVFLQRGDDSFFLAPIAVQCVDLIGPISGVTSCASRNATANVPRRAITDVPRSTTERHLADEVLDELIALPVTHKSRRKKT